ncbi:MULTISPECIES: nucleotide pyrophosphohydrolase [unclassified Thioalkalivibrio]|uniref:nucleotide pyrophosphohydrolase n=1 Tax=unclassified Thioalkalivibrio TaxID=2621013 RepID=UPI00037B1F3D|nr:MULTISPECIES: nucleotide pyrophosphohydrolase [unclassified Thioalkalivibrio]
MNAESNGTQSLEELASRVETFVEERDWAQFHSPKNLSMALAGEVGELIEHFQWVTQEQSRDLSGDVREAVTQEIADVQIYLLLLARKLDIDLVQAASDKLEMNARKYPVEKAHGNARKYSEL